MTRTDFRKVIIGRADLVFFTDLNIPSVPAKVDTGAYRSAVHASNIKLADDGKTLSFTLLGGHPIYGKLAAPVSTQDFKKVDITNSFGHNEERFEVRFKVKIGPKIFTASFSLADRAPMMYPILLGRKLLNDRFLVDTALTQVDRVELKQKYAIEVPMDEEAQAEEGLIA